MSARTVLGEKQCISRIKMEGKTFSLHLCEKALPFARSPNHICELYCGFVDDVVMWYPLALFVAQVVFCGVPSKSHCVVVVLSL